uniref:Putative trypsin-like serine protease n=1 Tax=Corethrella appendiculata TaxID=1370023 RepID=U5ENX1_9DIPT
MKFAIIVIVALYANCAYSVPHYDTRVVNGESAEVGQFPYQVQLVVTVPQGRALCGGSLISDQWVLTAGHCVEKASSFDVRLGAVKFSSDGNADGIVIKATKYIRHEKYNPLFAANDVALVQLPEKVTFSDTIQPVKISSGSDLFVGREVVVSGWGLQHDKGNVAEHLQYASLNVISNKECTQTFNPLVVKATTICAKGPQKQSPCQGDSGGPLVLADEGTLVGVVSFGHVLGCEQGFPGAFARITSFASWISQKTGIKV